MKSGKNQKGFSFSTFITTAFLLVVIAIFSMKLIPAYMESGKVQKALDAIVSDPSLQDATVDEIKMSFEKRAVIMDNVTAVRSSDLEIYKDNNRLSINAKYSVKVPLFGNISLLIDFNPAAPKK
jgi:hypothetical protein